MPCRATRLRVQQGSSLSTGSGQSNFVIVLRNISSSVCSLFGYPTVSLIDASGRPLAFQYTHSYGMFVTDAAPRSVRVPPGAVAYAAFEKYRCDRGDERLAATVRFTPPDSSQRFDVKITGNLFAYCGAGAPGDRVVVTPIEPTVRSLGYSQSQ